MENTIAVSIGVTAQRAVNYNPDRTSLAIANLSSTSIVYMGASNQVTPINGFPIFPGMIMTYNRGMGDDTRIERWMIAGAITDVRVTEEYGE